MSGWNEARDAMLRKLWSEGKTGKQIGVLLGVTRNAAIGRIHRLGLLGRPSPIKSKDPAATKAKRQASLKDAIKRSDKTVCRRDGARAVVEARERTAKLNGKPAAAPPKPVALPVRKASPYRKCQYLHGEPKRRNFCGKPTMLGKSWCELHYIACHEKQKPTEQKPESEAA
jgi:GcrA cell cycle regulator